MDIKHVYRRLHFILVSLFFIVGTCSFAYGCEGIFSSLCQRLVEDGLQQSFVDDVFGESKIQFSHRPVLANFLIRESTLDYGQFLTEGTVGLCREYAENYGESLKHVHEQFGVEPEIVIAILMVETKLGTYTGTERVMNVLSSFAIAGQPHVTKLIYKKFSPQNKKEYSLSRFSEYCKKKSDWAYSELLAFLRYAADTGIPVLDTTGSMAGAVGYPQFLPSNIVRYGYDGDEDGVVDMFSHPDAQASIGNYLREYGWREDLSEEQKRNIIFKYNRSDPYVDTIFALAVAIKR